MLTGIPNMLQEIRHKGPGYFFEVELPAHDHFLD